MNKPDISFEEIAESIIHTKKFNDLKKESHHGLTRYDHVMRVARYTYKIAKFLELDYVAATRAALLHDYFTNKEFNGVTGLKKGVVHPNIAYENAKKEFEISEVEKNAIVSHMFPLGDTIPKYKESWVLTFVDKSVATYEVSKYKLSNTLTIYMLFIINMLLFGQK